MSRRLQSTPEGTSTTAALTGRKKPAQDKERSVAALRHVSKNTSRPEGAKEDGELPKGWRWVTLGDVAESMKNGIYKPASSYADDGLACQRMYNIGDGKIVWRDVKRMHLSEAEIREYELLPGDLLVNRVNSRELVGKSVAIPTGLERCVFESKNIRVRIRRDLVSPEFVSYRLLSAGSRYFTQNAQQVVGMASISQPQVARFPLPLPPLPEQRRIVAEIEKQFTRLETGVAALRRVQANLKRYRAAVLKAACEGRLVPTEAELQKSAGRGQKSKARHETGAELLARILTERRKNWQGRSQYKEPAAPVTAHLPPRPAGWVVASLEQLTSATRPICYGILMPKENVTTGVLFVKVKDMKGDTIDLEGLHRTTPEIAAKYARAALKTRDLLLSIRGTYGRVAEVPKELDGGNITQDTARLDVTGSVNHRYIATCLRNPDCQNHFKRVARGVAVKGVNIGDVRPTPVPLPPLAEQTRIVAEVERRLSVVQELETVVSANLQRATRLRQSILQKAFTGGLVLSAESGNKPALPT